MLLILQIVLTYVVPAVILYLAYPYIKYFWIKRAKESGNRKGLAPKVVISAVVLGTVLCFAGMFLYAYLYRILK